MIPSYRLVHMDRYPHPDIPEYRVCEVTLERGQVVAWQPDTPAPCGEGCEDVAETLKAMGAALFMPVLREAELPGGEHD